MRDLQPCVDGDVFRGVVGQGLPELGVVDQAPDGSRVVAGQQGIAAVCEEAVESSVIAEDGLLESEILLKFGVTVLVGGHDKSVRLRHDIQLNLLGNITQVNAVLRQVWLQIRMDVTGDIEFDVHWQMAHGFANFVGAFPARCRSCINKIEAPGEVDRPLCRINHGHVCAIRNVMAFNAPFPSPCQIVVTQRHHAIGILDDAPLHPIHEKTGYFSENLRIDLSVNIVPAVDDLKGLVAAKRPADEWIERDRAAVSIDDVRLETVDEPGCAQETFRRRQRHIACRPPQFLEIVPDRPQAERPCREVRLGGVRLLDLGDAGARVEYDSSVHRLSGLHSWVESLAVFIGRIHISRYTKWP